MLHYGLNVAIWPDCLKSAISRKMPFLFLSVLVFINRNFDGETELKDVRNVSIFVSVQVGYMLNMVVMDRKRNIS